MKKIHTHRVLFSAFLLGWMPLLQLLTACHREGVADGEPARAEVKGDTVLIPTNSSPVADLQVEPVGRGLSEVVPLAGRLVWDEDVTVRVFTPFAGIVRKIFVGLNEPAKKAAPLAEIQSADFAQAQADVRKAQSDLRRAERNLNRLQDLFEHGAVPRKDVEWAEADYASASAEHKRATGRLAIYGASVDSSDPAFLLPSPLDGVLVEKNVTPGQEVRPDQMLANMPQLSAPLFVISDPSRLWIQIDATEADLPRFRPGCEFLFTSRAFPQQTFTGRVDTVSEFLDPATRTIKVRGTVENPRRQLKAEMFVSVDIPGETGASASVPAKAVFLKGEKHYVFVEKEAGQFARKEVELGPERKDRVMIVAGLEPGELVVTEGCLFLQRVLK